MPRTHNRTKLRVWVSAKHGRATELARSLGVSRQTIYQYMRGKKIPGIDNQVAIAQLTDGKVPVLAWPERRPTGRPPKQTAT